MSSAGPAKRILFQLPYPGYLRMYGSTIALLADRGDKLLLTYDAPDKRRDAPADELGRRERGARPTAAASETASWRAESASSG